MNFYKYFTFLALLVLCLLGNQSADAHFGGRIGHRLDKAAKKVDKVSSHIGTAQKVVAAGGAIAGVIAA